MPIKYLGSKRKLVDKISALATAAGGTTALDAFTGTTRVAQCLKQAGFTVTANDLASYSYIFGQCYIETDKDAVDVGEIEKAIQELMALPGTKGYFTQTFCENSRFIQPKNGMRIDAMREHIESNYKGTWLYPILLTSLIEAADRVDSTTGVQMAYLKKWAARSYNDIELRVPELISGTGTSLNKDVFVVLEEMDPVDIIYYDPPYNSHNYRGNFHIWETLTLWDKPEFYGVACKRTDIKDEETKSVFNKKREAPKAIYKMIDLAVPKCDTLLLSYNDESWIDKPTMLGAFERAGFEDWCVFEFDYDRYIGARIGIYNPSGELAGQVSHTKNHEYIFAGGSEKAIADMKAAIKRLSEEK